jgi:hypothetical protein
MERNSELVAVRSECPWESSVFLGDFTVNERGLPDEGGQLAGEGNVVVLCRVGRYRHGPAADACDIGDSDLVVERRFPLFHYHYILLPKQPSSCAYRSAIIA